MSEVTPERRTPVMILVDASWEDQSGTLVEARVRMENKSMPGACLRTKRRIAPATKVHVQWRSEEFSGVVKYCQLEAGEYRVGIRRDPAAQEPVEQLEARKVPRRAEATRKVNARVREVPGSQKPAIVPMIPVVAVPAVESRVNGVGTAELEQSGAALVQPEKVKVLPETHVPAAELWSRREACKERKSMGSKLLQLAHWRKREEEDHGNGSASNATGNPTSHNGPRKNGAHLGVASVLAEKSAAEAAGASAEHIQVELLPMEDIYRAAGIVNPRRGYSVRKVVEMLKSGHLRGLSKEMNRASVLMALDAAGVSMDDVLRDARVRQEAIDSYEAEQRKQFEALWAQKAKENMQINAELERVRASYAERIKRNQDGVAREKATFVGWLTTKQQEAQGINEPVGREFASGKCGRREYEGSVGRTRKKTSRSKARPLQQQLQN